MGTQSRCWKHLSWWWIRSQISRSHWIYFGTKAEKPISKCPVLSVASKPMSVLHLVMGDAAIRNTATASVVHENCLPTRCNNLGGERRALLCKCYHCTVKSDTLTKKELSWGKSTKYSKGQNLRSIYKIKYLIADWRTQGMIPNRISTQHKNLFTLQNKNHTEKYRWK